jgi:hypothetical protein
MSARDSVASLQLFQSAKLTAVSFASVEKSRADFIWLPLFKGWLEVSQKRPAGAQQHLSVTLTRIARSVHASPTRPAPFEQEGCRTPPAPTQHSAGT